MPVSSPGLYTKKGKGKEGNPFKVKKEHNVENSWSKWLTSLNQPKQENRVFKNSTGYVKSWANYRAKLKNG